MLTALMRHQTAQLHPERDSACAVLPEKGAARAMFGEVIGAGSCADVDTGCEDLKEIGHGLGLSRCLER